MMSTGIKIGAGGILGVLFTNPIIFIVLLITGVVFWLLLPMWATGIIFALIGYGVVWLLNGFKKWPFPSLLFILVMFGVGYASQSFSVFSVTPTPVYYSTLPAIGEPGTLIAVLMIVFAVLITAVSYVVLTRRK